jgi:hypothetical protein
MEKKASSPGSKSQNRDERESGEAKSLDFQAQPAFAPEIE